MIRAASISKLTGVYTTSSPIDICFAIVRYREVSVRSRPTHCNASSHIGNCSEKRALVSATSSPFERAVGGRVCVWCVVCVCVCVCVCVFGCVCGWVCVCVTEILQLKCESTVERNLRTTTWYFGPRMQRDWTNGFRGSGGTFHL